MFCSKCGKQVPDDAVFCPACGDRVRPDDNAAQIPTEDGVKVLCAPDPDYVMTCEYCFCKFEYKRKNLGYRPWYPKGFVYCPQCQKPLRHDPERNLK